MTTAQMRVTYELTGIEDSITRDIKPSLWPENAGYFVFIKAFFSFAEYLGTLAEGKIVENSSKEKILNPKEGTSVTVNFFKKYFSPTNKRYGELAYLLIYMYRHGTVHYHAPKRIRLSQGAQVGFLLFHEYQCKPEEKHKKILTPDEIEALNNCRHLEYIKDKWLAFSLNQAYDDILAATKKLKLCVSNDDVLAQQMHERLMIIKNGEHIDAIEWPSKRTKYLLCDNIEFLKKNPRT